METAPARRVLIIDESADVRNIAARILEKAGFAVTAAPSAEDVTGSQDVALVLISSVLAAGDGGSFRLLLEREPRPRVLISCSRFAACPVHTNLPCIQAGCVLKPDDFTTARLVPLVRAALSH